MLPTSMRGGAHCIYLHGDTGPAPASALPECVQPCTSMGSMASSTHAWLVLSHAAVNSGGGSSTRGQTRGMLPEYSETDCSGSPEEEGWCSCPRNFRHAAGAHLILRRREGKRHAFRFILASEGALIRGIAGRGRVPVSLPFDLTPQNMKGDHTTAKPTPTTSYPPDIFRPGTHRSRIDP